MPTYTILEGRDPLLMVDLRPGESIVAESNAMVMNDGGASVEGKLQGGVISSLARRIFSDESLFQQVISTKPGREAQVFLAPPLPGDIELVDVGERQFYMNSGCYMASDSTVGTSQRLNSSVLGSFFGGTGGFIVMRSEGEGRLAMCGFGQIIRVDVHPGEEVVVDNGHVVAWQTSLDYRVSTASAKRGLFGRMISTAMSGEFLVTKFSGEGHLYISSRNQPAFEEYMKAITGGKK